MKGLPFVLAFTAMTFVAWGAYGPLLHHGTASMGRDSVRAFVGVGIAYFFIAVLVPVYILRTQGETGKWTISGTFYSLIAGAVGALGALGVILALSYGGMPVYVMPLVFGFAPIVNTLVTAWMSKTFDQISPIFIGGIVVAALGVAGVLAFKPSAPPHADHPTKATDSDTPDHKTGDDKKHSHIERRSVTRFVTIVAEPVIPQDDLPPVVVQPSAPADTNAPAAEKPAEQVVAPEKKDEPNPPAQEPPAVAPQTEPSQELPPVVVQPMPPSDAPQSAPAAPAVAQAEAPALPPVVTQPTAEPPKPEATKVEPKVEAPKAEPSKTETPTPEAPKTETIEPKVTKPQAEKPAAELKATEPVPTEPKPIESEAASTKPNLDKSTEPTETESKTKPTTPPPNVPMIIVSIIVAAICWGSYGPMLHQGQARMSGSRLRPFTCVGLAYFVIAVAAPLAVIASRTADTGAWSTGGLTWSIIAGAAGAIGALGVILAFNAGGKPYYVMPLVFGFAPVINTCISLTEAGTWGLVRPEFWISLAVVITGAITVLITAPKPQHGKPHAPAPATKS